MVITSPIDTLSVASVASTRSKCSDSAAGTSDAQPAAKIEISQAGSFFSKLEQLKTQDPEKLKQLLGDLASQLQSAAQASSGSEQQFLSKLADKFKEASASGDLTALHPHKGHGHHHKPETYPDPNTQSVAATINGAQTTTAVSASSGPSLKDIFDKISGEVSAALAA